MDTKLRERTDALLLKLSKIGGELADLKDEIGAMLDEVYDVGVDEGCEQCKMDIEDAKKRDAWAKTL